MNAGNSKVMAGSSGGKMIVNSVENSPIVFKGKEYRQAL